jgi:hypothetical protein
MIVVGVWVYGWEESVPVANSAERNARSVGINRKGTHGKVRDYCADAYAYINILKLHMLFILIV